MSASTDEELGLELALDQLEAELSGEESPSWSPARRQLVARAAATRGLRRRTMQLLQVYAAAWIEQASAVRAARLAAPGWAAYSRLRAAQEATASQLFDADWAEVLRWCGGVPSAPLPAPAPIAAMAPGWAAGARALPWQPAMAALQRMAQPLLRPYDLEIKFSSARPRTRITWVAGFGKAPGAHITIELRDDRDTPRAWFQLLHELGHALAGVICPVGWLPRAVDEAVAAWLARHLEEPGSFPALPPLAFDAALHGQERARRAAIAGALAHLEAHPVEDRGAGPAALASTDLPWALWHDGGAQPAYLHAEALATRWWNDGLRVTDLTALARAIAYAIAEARALPAPLATVRA